MSSLSHFDMLRMLSQNCEPVLGCLHFFFSFLILFFTSSHPLALFLRRRCHCLLFLHVSSLITGWKRHSCYRCFPKTTKRRRPIDTEHKRCYCVHLLYGMSHLIISESEWFCVPLSMRNYHHGTHNCKRHTHTHWREQDRNILCLKAFIMDRDTLKIATSKTILNQFNHARAQLW